MNPVTGHGTSRDRRSFTMHNLSLVIDVAGLTMWRSDDILGRIAEFLPGEATRRGAVVRTADDGKELGDAMDHEYDRLDVMEKFRQAGAMDRALGGAAIFPVLDGAVGTLDTPLTDEMAWTEVKALQVFEPRELVPHEWESDITSPLFRRPRSYSLVPIHMFGTPTTLEPYTIVHASRLITWPGIRTVQRHADGQRVGWGDSVFNRVAEIVEDFGMSWASVATLLSEFAQAVYQRDGLRDALRTKGGVERVMTEIELFDRMRSTVRAAVVDGRDKFVREQTPVSGLAELLVQMAQRVAAAAGMKVTTLMGISPAGLNATGESDIRGEYDNIERYRGTLVRPLRQLTSLLWRQADGPTNGEEPERWSIEWPPLWQPTEKEVAETRKLIAETDKIYAVDIGNVSGATIARSRWGGDKFSGEMHVDEQDLDALEAHEQEIQQAQIEAIKNPPPQLPAGKPEDDASSEQRDTGDEGSGGAAA